MEHDFRKVLVVDDDPVAQQFLSGILSPAGFQVSLASNGSQAIEMNRLDCFDFVITELSIPVMDGIELCQRLRNENLPHYVYIVFLTEKTHSKDLVAALSAGADDFIAKPAIETELLARLQAGARVLDLESRLCLLAKYDPLTEVLNRRTFFEQLEVEWSRSVRYASELSCVMVDIDHFKKVNDRYGHLVGDVVLKSIAQLLDEQSRKSDYLCRYGGEEFCLLLPETDEQGALVLADRCRSAIAEKQFSAKSHVLHITASFGIAQLLNGGTDAEQLIHMADQALLDSKRQGRNRVTLSSALELR